MLSIQVAEPLIFAVGRSIIPRPLADACAETAAGEIVVVQLVVDEGSQFAVSVRKDGRGRFPTPQLCVRDVES